MTKTRVWQQSAPIQVPQEKPKDNSIFHHQPFPGLESSCYSVNTFSYTDRLDLSRKLTLPPFFRLLHQGPLNILWLLDISYTSIQSLRTPSLFSTSGLLLFLPRM